MIANSWNFCKKEETVRIVKSFAKKPEGKMKGCGAPLVLGVQGRAAASAPLQQTPNTLDVAPGGGHMQGSFIFLKKTYGIM